MSKRPTTKGRRGSESNAPAPLSLPSEPDPGAQLVRMDITWDIIPDPEIERLPKRVKEKMAAIHHILGSHPEDVIDDLKILIPKYPKVICFKNWLGVCLRRLGRKDEAWEICRTTFNDHPDYLFGRLAMVAMILEEGDLESAKAVLYMGGRSLPAIYPDQKVFHISEVENWYYSCAQIMIREGNIEGAIMHRDFLAAINPGSSIVTALNNLLLPPDLNNLLPFETFKKMAAEMAARREQRAAARKAAKKSSSASIKKPRKP